MNVAQQRAPQNSTISVRASTDRCTPKKMRELSSAGRAHQASFARSYGEPLKGYQREVPYMLAERRAAL